MSEHPAVIEYTDWDSLPRDCLPLFASPTSSMPWQSIQWFRLVFDSGMDDARSLRIFVLQESSGGNTTCLAALPARSPACPNGSIMHHRPIHEHSLSGLTSFQTHFFDAIVGPDTDHRAAWKQFAAHLSSVRPAFNTLDFACVGSNRESASAIADAFNAQGYRAYVYPNFVRRFESHLGESFAHYASSRKAIKEYLRKERKLEREVDTKCHIYDSADRAEEAISVYTQVAESSWKPPERFPQFMDSLLKEGIEQGFVRVCALFVDDLPVATSVVFVNGRKATMYRSDYNPEYSKRSVGAVCLCKTLRYLIDEAKVESLDFGRDDEGYKQFWASELETVLGVVAYNPRTYTGLAGLILHQVDRAKGSVKAMLRSIARKKD